MERQKRVALYVRVSTTDKQDTEMQVRELQEYAKLRGWNVVSVFEDRGTGTNANRKDLKRAMVDAKARRYDILAVWKLDRIFRATKDCLNHLHELTAVGVEFVSLQDPGIDTTTPIGAFLTTVLAAVAELEASFIRARVRAGVANARAKGKRLGRPRMIDPSKALELRAKGMSLSQIAAVLGTTKGAVSKSLKKSTRQVVENSGPAGTPIKG